MQETDTTRERTQEGSIESQEAPSERHDRSLFQWRYLLVYLVLVGLILLAILPPLINVSRFKRRIVTSISTSIGRPVHLDSVSLVLLPFPGFKLENFVVEEAPAFGAEPIIHANNVVATLRVNSLWRRKVEFSKISLQEPSINLVHMADGTWNVESVLLQAAKISAAPTAQAKAGPDPRFPYIEATGARVNIKFGDEKLPLSLTEADFALWLPRPQQWRIRIEGKPTRTDTSSSDTGTVSLEGTLGHAERFDLIPIDLLGEWKNAPLGEASRVATGRDAGLRGDLKLTISAHGTVGNSLLKAALQLRGVRRAEFVPPQALNLRAECQATTTGTFHALHDIRCSWPPLPAPSQLALIADVPDIRNVAGSSYQIGTPGIPADTLLDWLRIASPRVSPDITVTGTLTGSVSRETEASDSGSIYSGRLALRETAIAGGPIGDSPVILGSLTIASTPHAEPPMHSPHKDKNRAKSVAANESPSREFVMSPATIMLGGKEPALLEGRFDRNGYTLHLYGNVVPARLLALAASLPQFGDGLSAVLQFWSPSPTAAPLNKDLPTRIDITANRLWSGGQSWAKSTAKPARTASQSRQ